MDDVLTINNSITKLLDTIIKENSLNMKVVQCFDGVDLLSQVLNDQKNGNLIDFVICDENMDFINGTEAITLLRKLEKEKRIKIPYIVSSTTEEFIHDKLSSLGVTKILSKPINKNSLINLMNELNLI